MLLSFRARANAMSPLISFPTVLTAILPHTLFYAPSIDMLSPSTSPFPSGILSVLPRFCLSSNSSRLRYIIIQTAPVSEISSESLLIL
eukprot:750462-Hanusia_phi.AAC.3